MGSGQQAAPHHEANINANLYPSCRMGSGQQAAPQHELAQEKREQERKRGRDDALK
jgi:hypothetical protein